MIRNSGQTKAATQTEAASSYTNILQSASIIGGAEAVNQVVGLVRSKLVAVLLGPAGIGLVGLYVSAAGFLGVIAQLGINQSGVREIADASAKGDMNHVALVAKALSRTCWLTGVLGWILTAAFALPLSQWTFGSTAHTWSLAILGSTIVLSNVNASRIALLQGLRRLGDIARVQLSAAVANTMMAVGLYFAFGDRAIIPVIVLTGVIQLSASWYFSKRVGLNAVTQSASDSFYIIKALLPLGLALMYTGVLVNVVGLGTRAVIFREVGEDAAGWYQAAWMLSGMFAGFIFNAMGTDFYPRLSGIIYNPIQANTLVNQQIEIGMLLAAPGLVGTLCFAPQLLELLYSSKFIPAASCLSLFVLGCFLKTLSWPVSFILLARKESFCYGTVATVSMSLQMISTIFFVHKLGFLGVGFALLVGESLLVIMDTMISRRLTGFRWSHAVIRVMTVCAVFFALGLSLRYFCDQEPYYRMLGGFVLLCAAGVYSLRGLNSRLDGSHGVIRRLRTFPGLRQLLGPAP